MPRTRKRTTEKASWTAESLKVAADLVQQGQSIHKVAKKTNIPYSTLQRKLKKVGGRQIFESPRLGRHAVFSKEQESILVDHLITMSNMFHGLTSQQLRKIAYTCAESLGIPHTFNREKEIAGRGWINSFLKRNPQISVRKPEATSINRITGFNKNEVDRFFANLDMLMTKFKFGCHEIFNVDETGITTVQDPSIVLAPKGQKRVGSITSWERGKNITVICAMSAAGTYVPPLFIFPRKRHSPQLEKGGPLAAVYECTPNGWTTEQIFLKWLNHFKDFVKPTQEKPVLLILDNHNSHATLEAYNFCKKNNIIMLSLPPHSSHRMQPLDVTFFGPLKGAYHKECDLFIKSHNLQKITPYEIAGLFNKAYIKVASVEKGISGFQATGIFPMNPGKFTDEDFIDFDDTLVEESAIPINQVVERQDIEEAIPSTSFASPTTTSMVMNADAESSNVVVHENPISRSEYQENVESFCSLLSNLSPLPSIQKNKGIGKGRKGP